MTAAVSRAICSSFHELQRQADSWNANSGRRLTIWIMVLSLQLLTPIISDAVPTNRNWYLSHCFFSQFRFFGFNVNICNDILGHLSLPYITFLHNSNLQWICQNSIRKINLKWHKKILDFPFRHNENYNSICIYKIWASNFINPVI